VQSKFDKMPDAGYTCKFDVCMVQRVGLIRLEGRNHRCATVPELHRTSLCFKLYLYTTLYTLLDQSD